MQAFVSHAVLCVALAAASGPIEARAVEFSSIEVMPATVNLTGQRSRQQLLVTGLVAPSQTADLTRSAQYRSLDEKIVAVDSKGVLSPRGQGEAAVIVRVGSHEQRVGVQVGDISVPDLTDFRTEAIAALSRSGCSQGACHGSPQGKNGFRLSLRGYDPDLDLGTLTRESAGRRINIVHAEESLLLRKGSGGVAHQGGIRFRRDEPAYQTLRQWIAEGGRESETKRKLVRLEVLPNARRLHSEYPQQQVVALAHFDDGSVRDVSPLAVFSATNDPAFEVTAQGEVNFQSTAEATVLVRYLEQVKSVRLTYVKHDAQFVYAGPAPSNIVDQHVFAKQQQLQLQVAKVADDAVFLRRVYLDVTGMFPTADEARTFLLSKAPDKRAKLIDSLLEREEYAQFWAMKWADIMRGSRETISLRGVHSFHRYLVKQFAADRPFTEWAAEVLTSSGNTLYRPEANFYRIANTPEDAAESMAQLFLGVRVQCARCHNHPFEALTQGDYYGLAAYFARVKNKGKQFMVDDTTIYLTRNGEVQHPLLRKPVEPIAFGTAAGTMTPDDDRRERLAAWLVSSDNKYFAPSTVNRIWYHLLGQGIVDPVDDFRDSNPPSHPELLQSLAQDFVRGGYRFKPILRTILNSKTYQLDGRLPEQSSPAAARGDRYFVRAKIRMLTAEQILDGISQATGIPEVFPGYPVGTRAIELAEGAVEHHFLTAFAKPIRDQQCDCAREEEPSLNQVIHLLNNSSVVEKTRATQGFLQRALAENKSTLDIVDQVYLAMLSRFPTADEKRLAEQHVATVGDRATALEDLQHALLNLNEFLLRH